VTDWSCASCEGGNPDANAFCGQCGSPRAVPPKPVADETWGCRGCGTSNPVAAAFCGGCGQQRGEVREKEVRLVTALFADISGFTALADVLDTEALHDVVTPLVTGLSEIAQRYGGFVEKYAGDALLVVYGAPVTHDDDPQRALLAAHEMHACLPGLLSRLDPRAAELTIHVGVNTGRVIGRQAGSAQQSDYAVLGDSVILAQRLESVCPPGETYVGASTYALCRDDFVFDALPPLTLKGKSAAVEAYRLVGPRLTPADSLPPLVGRVPELRVLERVLDDLSAGTAATVTITGDAGSGKSRLVDAMQAEASARGVQWWAARCLSYGSSLPYWPFADLLRRISGIEPGDEPSLAREKVARAVPAEAVEGALLLLSLADEVFAPQAARRTVHDAVVRWLERESRQPCVLVVEDVHWIDNAAGDLLREVVVQVPALAVVLTARPGPLAPLYDDSRPQQVVELRGLQDTAVADVAAAVLGGRVGPLLGALLLSRTGGNPLFVEQLAKALAESGSLVPSTAGWELRPGQDLDQIPATVEQVLATRVDALPPAAASLLQFASVIGRAVSIPLLRGVAGDAALSELSTLVAAGLLDRADDDVLVFHHALLQDVVHTRLLRRRRRELHKQVADVGRALYGDGDETVGLIARHLYLAEAGQEAVDALLRAGRRAASLYANDEAAVHLAHAVEVLESVASGVPPDLRLELAALQETRGAYDEALALYGGVRRSTGSVAAWRGELAVLRARGHYDEALVLCEQAHQAGLRAPELELERATTLMNAGQHAEAVPVFERAVADVREDALAARMLANLARALVLGGRRDEALRSAQGAVQRARASADPREEATALRIQGDVLFSLKRLEETEEVWTEALRLARRTGTIDEEAGLLLNLGYLELERANPAAALVHNEQAIAAFERLGHGSGVAIGYGNLAWTVLELGRVQECLDWCARATARAEAIGHLGTLADVARTRAFALQRLGRDADARASAAEAAAMFDRMGQDEDRDACLEMTEAGVRGSS